MAEDERDIVAEGNPGDDDATQISISKYKRGQNVDHRKIKDKKLRGNLQKLQKRFGEAAYHAARSEMLLPEEPGYIEVEGMEKTYKITQEQLKKEVDITTAQKGFNLELNEFGPYAMDYTRTGRHLLLGGRKGHIAAMDWREGRLQCEIQVRETVRSVQWLQDVSMFAVAQKKYVYIYDKTGTEVHCLRKHIEVTNMEYLPYHFLLTTVGNAGYLKYQDVSTGNIVAEHRTKLGSPTSMTQNPQNAIIHLGHSNGTVTLWSPNMGTPLVKMFTHHGPVKSLAIDREGRYMVSAGADYRVKVWDVRNYREVHSYYTQRPSDHVAISELGLLGIGWGGHVSIWKDALRTKQQSPYMAHDIPSETVSSLYFCPFDDLLGVGHTNGFTSLIVPGSGEPNFDAREINPYQTSKQRQETEIRSLLDKLQPEMISLDPEFIGNIDLRPKEVRRKALEEEDAEERGTGTGMGEGKEKKKAKGKNSAMKRYLRRKTKNVIDERAMRMEAVRKREREEREGKGQVATKLPPVLSRFERKGD